MRTAIRIRIYKTKCENKEENTYDHKDRINVMLRMNAHMGK